MKEKIRVGIVFGGKSAEHEVSLQSAKSIIEAIDKDKFEIVLIGIDHSGKWYLNEDTNYLLNANDPKQIQLFHTDDEVGLIPGEESNQLMNINTQQRIGAVNVVFPVLHGPFGEDGTIQGLLKLANIPFVGASVLGSAVGMDKDVMKRLLRDAGIPIARFLVCHRIGRDDISFDTIAEDLGLPLFIKPANLGSSVGVSKVKNRDDFSRALQMAFEYDSKVIIEEFIDGREIECSVLGNESPRASVPGEILPQHEFYSYEAKYIDENGALLEIPAKLSAEISRRVQELAVQSYQVLCCEGMARVDFFLRSDTEVIVNEINTIPGFTKISMYPKLWEASGLPYVELIEELIQLAIERFEREQQLKTQVEL
jgi:D-alanine-D-alanine ligase